MTWERLNRRFRRVIKVLSGGKSNWQAVKPMLHIGQIKRKPTKKQTLNKTIKKGTSLLWFNNIDTNYIDHSCGGCTV